MAKLHLTTLESSLWDLMKAGAQKNGAHAQRIESPSTGMGIPDVNCTYNGVDFWAELKVVKGNQIKFQPGQPGWLQKRWAAQGLCWIVARKTLGDSDTIYVWPGRDAVELSKKGLKLEPHFTATKKRYRGSFAWGMILDCMTQRVV